jgi:hypothetical protein
MAALGLFYSALYFVRFHKNFNFHLCCVQFYILVSLSDVLFCVLKSIYETENATVNCHVATLHRLTPSFRRM